MRIRTAIPFVDSREPTNGYSSWPEINFRPLSARREMQSPAIIHSYFWHTCVSHAMPSRAASNAHSLSFLPDNSSHRHTRLRTGGAARGRSPRPHLCLLAFALLQLSAKCRHFVQVSYVKREKSRPLMFSNASKDGFSGTRKRTAKTVVSSDNSEEIPSPVIKRTP